MRILLIYLDCDRLVTEDLAHVARVLYRIKFTFRY